MENARQDYLLIGFLILIALASGGDLLADLSHGSGIGHLLQESIILVITLLILFWLVIEHRRKNLQLAKLRKDLDEALTMPGPESPQVNEARHKLGQAIVEQFAIWKLTTSEKEVGLLLLKGCTLKEIALLRGTAEKTIRQQASAIYQKSGVSGRHAFSAWFIEDLL